MVNKNGIYLSISPEKNSIQIQQRYIRWWFQILFTFTEMIQFDYFFKRVLKPPTSIPSIGILGAFVYSPLATWRAWLRSHDVTIVNFWIKRFFRSICPKIPLQIVSVQPMDHPSALLLFFVFAVCFTFFLTGVDHMFREVVLDCQSFPWFSPQNIVRFCIVFPIILLFLGADSKSKCEACSVMYVES